MGCIVLDPAAVRRLEAARESAEIRDEGGRLIGIFQPIAESISPQERAELETRRLDRSGKRLDQVLKGFLVREEFR